MKRKLKISFDIDDVLADFVGTLVRFYNKVYDKDIQFEDVNTWTLYETLSELKDAEGQKIFVEAFMRHPEFEYLAPNLDFVLAAQALAEDHDIHFITSRSSKSIDTTYKWLHFFGLPINQVHFNKDKGWLVRHLEIDVHIDDGRHNLERIHMMCGSRTKLFLVDRPWNSQRDAFDEIDIWTRIDNPSEIFKYIEEQEKIDEDNSDKQGTA